MKDYMQSDGFAGTKCSNSRVSYSVHKGEKIESSISEKEHQAQHNADAGGGILRNDLFRWISFMASCL